MNAKYVSLYQLQQRSEPFHRRGSPCTPASGKSNWLFNLQDRTLKRVTAFAVRKNLQQVGWTKGLELAQLAHKQAQRSESATWLHRARQMPKEEFRREVEKELTGEDREPSELVYFKVYKSQIPVIEQAIETAGLMLGSDNFAATRRPIEVRIGRC